MRELGCDQLSVALNDTADDLQVLDHFPAEASLLFGIIYSDDLTLETLDTMFCRLKSVVEYVPLEQIILTSNCGFSPYARERKLLPLVWNKLSQLVRLAKVINESGLCATAAAQAEKDVAPLREEHERLLQEERE